MRVRIHTHTQSPVSPTGAVMRRQVHARRKTRSLIGCEALVPSFVNFAKIRLVWPEI